MLRLGLGFCIGMLAWGPSLAQPMQVSGQPPLRDEVAVAGQYGYFWAHSETVEHLQSHHVAGWVTVMPARWQAAAGLDRRKRAKLALTGGYIYLNRPELGSAIPVLATFENGTRPAGKPNAFFYRLGMGIAGLTHPYQIERNPFNRAYSLPVSWALQARLGFEQRVGKTDMQLGICLTHFSNSSLRLPNAGVNLIGAYLSVGYGRANGRYRRAPSDSLPRPPRHVIDLVGATGWKAFDTYPAPVYWCGLLRVDYRYSYGLGGDFVLGFDWIYNGALREGRLLTGNPNADFNRLGITVGHEWYLSRQIAFSTHIGFYVRDPVPIDKPYYQRYGVRFFARKRLAPAVWFRAHLGSADCVELALNYSLWER